MEAGRRYDALSALVVLFWRGWRYLWQDYLTNWRVRSDFLGAIILGILVVFVPTDFLERWFARLSHPWQWAATVVWWAILLGGPFWSGLASFLYLKRRIAYEDLRIPAPPKAKGIVSVVLSYPVLFTVVVVVGISAGMWMLGVSSRWWGAVGLKGSLQRGFWWLVNMLPPVAEVVRRWGWEPALPWPNWMDKLVWSLLFLSIVALLRTWVNFRLQRVDVCSGLVKPRQWQTPYGFRADGLSGQLAPEPHEQVLLMQAERIGSECLSYLSVELYGLAAELRSDAPADPWGALAALERIFAAHGQRCWQENFRCAEKILRWAVQHLDCLTDDFLKNHSSRTGAHRLAQTMVTVGRLIHWLPERPSGDTSSYIVGSEARKQVRACLRRLFPASHGCPPVFVACCETAELLGTEQDIQLLDQQIRFLDVQAGFSVEETDRILETRDRLWKRTEAWRCRRREVVKRIQAAGLEPEENPLEKEYPVFRRQSDGARMVLIEAGSFVRGDPNKPESSPRRRIYLGDYLIDIDPVSAEAFRRFVESQGQVIRLDRGFFPVQNLTQASQSGPALHVTWYAAEAYARWAIGQAHSSVSGHLPTEAQWEKAARGPVDDRQYPSGSEWQEPPLSPYGIRIGDLLEWCRDAYDERAYEINPVLVNPVMEAASRCPEARRVVRGKHPERMPTEYSLADRTGADPVEDGLLLPVGFRVVLEIPNE